MISNESLLMNHSATYQKKRDRIEAYFDRTAADQWARLTSDAPVSGIRKTVRAGRDRMRETLLSWLPEDLHGRRDRMLAAAQVQWQWHWLSEARRLLQWIFRQR